MLPVINVFGVTIIKVGASGANYTTIAAAYNSISNATGGYIIELQSNYNPASETYPITLGSVTGANSSTNSITIRPVTGNTSVFTFATATAAQLFYLNGAKYVTIDGLDRTKFILSNTAAVSGASNAILISNDASNNTIRNITAKGQSSVIQSAVIQILAGTTNVTGCDNNTIDNCDVCNAGSYPLVGIGSHTGIVSNNNLTISNCNIYNISTALSSAAGIALDANNSNPVILNNRIYWTTSMSVSTTASYLYGINVLKGGANSRIEGNVIGYSNKTASANATFTGTSGDTWFYGINVASAGEAFPVIKNNIVGGFNLSNGFGRFYGINVFPSLSGISSITGNTIKDISYSSYADGSVFYGILCRNTSTTGALMIGGSTPESLNEIKNINLTTTVPANAISFYGIAQNGTPGINLTSISSNKIHDITIGTNSTAANTLIGIDGIGSTQTIEKNFLYNLKVYGSVGSVIKGIRTSPGAIVGWNPGMTTNSSASIIGVKPEDQSNPYTMVDKISPKEGWSLTDVGVSLRWWRQLEKNVYYAAKYQVQVASEPTFTSPLINEMVDAPGGGSLVKPTTNLYTMQMSYIPTIIIPAGKWYWRVRVADGNGALWSTVSSFNVNNSHTFAAPVRPISSTAPLVVFNMWYLENRPNVNWSTYWNFFPEDLKSTACLQINFMPYDKGDPVTFFQNIVATSGATLVIGTGGPDKAVSQYADLSTIEYLFQTEPKIIGIVTGETFWGFPGVWGTAEWTYYNRLLQLCAKYGRVFIEGNGNSGSFNWDNFLSQKPATSVMTKANMRLNQDVIKQYAKYYIPCFKTNILGAMYQSESALLGGHLSGLFDNYGAWHEAWYWSDARFNDIFQPADVKGDLRKMPPIIWNQSYMIGTAAGATVFVFGGESSVTEGVQYNASTDLLTNGSPYTAPWDGFGNKTPVLDRNVIPFMRSIVSKGMIPSTTEVLNEVKLTVNPGNVLAGNTDPRDYATYASLYRATYGIRDYQAYDPNANSPYYTISLPANTSARYIKLVLPGTPATLNIAEVEVYSGLQMVSLGAIATQSSTAFGGTANLAVDGNTSGDFAEGSITHTATENNPWWQLDLGSMIAIDKILIYPRTGYAETRLKGVVLTLVDNNRNTTYTYQTGVPPVVAPTPNGCRYEILPNNGRYYFIPVLPYPATALAGKPMVSLSNLQSQSSVRALFDPLYPVRYTGDAWVSLVNDKVYVMNNHENSNVEQSYSIPFTGRFITNIAGAAIPHWYLQGKFSADNKSFWFQCNANIKGPYTDSRSTDVTFTCPQQPTLTIEPSTTPVLQSWNAATNQLNLKIPHTAGAVEVTLKE